MPVSLSVCIHTCLMEATRKIPSPKLEVLSFVQCPMSGLRIELQSPTEQPAIVTTVLSPLPRYFQAFEVHCVFRLLFPKMILFDKFPKSLFTVFSFEISVYK